MSHEIKADLLPKLKIRYARRNREGKSRMLDELCEDHGYERKYAIKLLSDTLPKPTGTKHPGPERQYASIEPIVRQIWLSADQPCGKRLVPILHQWLPFYERRFESLSVRSRRLVRQISAATLDRLLAEARAQFPGKGRCGTKPGSLLKTEIPIRTGTWDITRPGYLEADSVAHCGASLAGSFIWSLTYTDILTGWTEGREVQPGCSAPPKTWKQGFLLLFWVLIATTAASFSITISGPICPSERCRWNSLDPVPITVTITLMSNKRIGHGHGNSWAIIVWRIRNWSPPFMPSTKRSGGHCRTSFCLA